MSEKPQISLHPLPILNISDHFTRLSLQNNDPNVRVVGGLLGTQQGREIEIMNTFEIVVEKGSTGEMVDDTKEGGEEEWKVDHAYFVTRRDQFKQVFPTFDFLGWYTVSSSLPSSSDLALHKQFISYNETPLHLSLEPPSSSHSSKDLPIKIYETILDPSGEVGLSANPVGYEIETGEAERVAVDWVSKAGNSGGNEGEQNGLIQSLSTHRSALKMLSDRVSIILLYLEQVSVGKVEKDFETIRLISSLVAGLPKGLAGGMASEELKEEFMTEYNDVLLTTLLSSLTSTLKSTNELLDKQLLYITSNAQKLEGGHHGDERRGMMGPRVGRKQGLGGGGPRGLGGMMGFGGGGGGGMGDFFT